MEVQLMIPVTGDWNHKLNRSKTMATSYIPYDAKLHDNKIKDSHAREGKCSFCEKKAKEHNEGTGWWSILAKTGRPWGIWCGVCDRNLVLKGARMRGVKQIAEITDLESAVDALGKVA